MAVRTSLAAKHGATFHWFCGDLNSGAALHVRMLSLDDDPKNNEREEGGGSPEHELAGNFHARVSPMLNSRILRYRVSREIPSRAAARVRLP